METYISLELWSMLYFIGTLVILYITHWIYKWMNPKSNGVLPPGSMGFPLIGETIQLVIPSASLDLPPFIKNRIKRYGPIFKTNVARRAVIITADPEFNHFLLRHDEKLVESWSMDTYAEVFDQARQSARKYTRNVTLNHFGMEALRGKLLPQLEDEARETLSKWARHESVEIKSSAVSMAIGLAAKQIFSGDLETSSSLKLGEMFRDIIGGLMSFPINIPGTAHYKSLQAHKKVREMMRDVVTKRMGESERRNGDLLDHILDDNSTFLNEELIVQLMFGLLYVASDSVSTTLALAFKLLAEHPPVLEELTAEHDAILKKRGDSNSSLTLTWDEYKSMTFTFQMKQGGGTGDPSRGNIAPGIFRRALKDIPINGYIIPQGWVILIATAGLHLNDNQFEDPLKFNPWRWKDIQPRVVAECFMPFGYGMKQCAGAEYSRVLLATFLHVLVTKYRWDLVKGGKIVRSPIIKFPDGFHYKLSEKQK